MRNQEWLDTDDLVSDLQGRSARGGAYIVVAQVAKVLVEIATTLVLARLLTPEDFGLVGMVIVVTGFIALFQDLGLSMATVQREKISQDEVSALFWINAGLGVGLTLLTAISAPVFAYIYGVPELTTVALGVSIAFILGSLGVQHQALLRRQMFLGRLAFVELISIAGSLAIALGIAVEGGGHLALVAKIVAAPALLTFSAWIACSWKPSMPKRTDVRELLKFGGNLTGFSLVNYLARNLDDFLIGKLFGAQELGIYQKSYEILMVPLRQLNAPVSSLAIPMLSRMVDQPERYKRTYLRLLEKVLLVTMPAAGWLMATSQDLVVVVLGDQWVLAGPIVMWLALSMVSQPIGNSTGWLFITQNRTGDMFKWGWIGSATAVVSFLIGLPWGALGVALAYSVVGVLVRTPLLIWYVTRKGPLVPRDFYKMAFPMALAGLATFGAVAGIQPHLAEWGSVERLAAGTGLAVVVALIVLLVLPGSRAAIFDLKTMAAAARKTS